MKISELLSTETMILELQAQDKPAVFTEMAQSLHQAGIVSDQEQFIKDLTAREEQSTTGIGEGVAIPHAKSKAVEAPAIAFGRSTEGIDFASLDGAPSHLFFMIAVGDEASDLHLDALSRLSTYLMDETFREAIMKAVDVTDILALINNKEAEEAEEAEDQDDATTNPSAADQDSNEPSSGQRILAVTACPTGIAHTYMAAEKLTDVAESRGMTIKVETNGSSGVKNQLTREEIREADAIIVAADTKVETDRFDGKPVIQTSVAKAINESEALIEQIETGHAPVYESHQPQQTMQKDEKTGFYKHLMNGVSNMLPFVVGGGILIALSFFWGINAANPDSPQYNQFAAMLSTIGGGKAFFLMVPVLAGFIASSIADRPGFAPGMVGGLIAITVTGAEGASGGSGFLGGLIAGFLAGYITVVIKKMFSRLPDALEGLKPVLFYPLFSIAITGLIMMVINPPLTNVYTGISAFLESMGGTNQILLGLLLGAMMSFDMGGPVNKAAYTFGIAMLDAGNFSFMAAIMAAGMIPPLGMAIASSLFKKRFTTEERDAGKTAYPLGLCFITEGAIPFAAADPVRVIPASMIGASITGGLTMLFDIGLRAPHGGIFVIGLVNGGITSIVLYLAAIAIGALITALIAGMLKKNVQTA